MDGVEVLAFLTLILLLGVIALVVSIAMGRVGGRGSRVAAWLGLTALSMWAVFGIAFIADFAILFAFGEGAAGAALAVSAAALVLTPLATGIVVTRISHHPAH